MLWILMEERRVLFLFDWQGIPVLQHVLSTTFVYREKKIYIKTTWRYTYRESIAISFIQGEMYMPLINNTKKATPLVFCNIKPLRKREHGANQMIINQVKSAFLCFNIWEVQVYYMYDNQYTTWVVH